MSKKLAKKHKKRKNKDKKSTGNKNIVVVLFRIFFMLILISVLAISCVYAIELKKVDGNATRAAVNIARKVADTVVQKEPVYVLLLGYSTDEGTSLTDTIIYMGYNPLTQKAFMISIPRDTFVGTNIEKATGYDKINSLYKVGNANKIKNVVRDLLGDIKIDYYVTVNTKALTQIVDAIGGVEFNVPINMNYDDRSQNLHIHLNAGPQLIDGKKAEWLLRFRHNNNGTSYPTEYGNNDYGRMRTQREFILATLKQCLETKDISTLKNIITTIFDNLETDCPLTTIFSYLVCAYDFNTENLQMEQLAGKSIKPNSIWVFESDKKANKEMMEEIMRKFNSETSNLDLESEEKSMPKEIEHDTISCVEQVDFLCKT